MMWNPFKKKEGDSGKGVEDYNIYKVDEDKTEEEMDKEIQKIIDTLKSAKYGGNIIAAQITAQIKRRVQYEVGGEDIHLATIECKYAAPIPLPPYTEGKLLPEEYIFFGDPTRIKFDTEKVKKIFLEEIEKIKKYYPDFPYKIGFIQEEQ